MKTDWSGKRVTVMGLGLFGGGVGVARYFADRGAMVLVADLRSEADLADSVREVEGINVSFRFGEHRLEDFTDTDLVIANPAVPPDNRFLEAARKAGVPIESEIGLFMKLCPAAIVGVTGSNGKSTTAALIAHILTSAGRTCHLGGNIGKSLLPEVHRIAESDDVVLEISSFQLEYLHAQKLSPHVAVVMNVQPNHLDRHGTMARYAETKRHIVEHQKDDDFAVLNADDRVVRAMADHTQAHRLYFSLDGPQDRGAWLEGGGIRYRTTTNSGLVEGLQAMKLIGRHNLQNACAATAVAAALGVAAEVIAKAIIGFEPLPHRLQTVAAGGGVTWINDSIATNPTSVAAALSCFDGNVILIAGGSRKDVPYDEMLGAVREKVKLLLLIGRTAAEIEAAVRAAGDPVPEIVQAGTLEEAVRIARKRAVSGGTVLLSPACASFDQFRNFQERGDRFAVLARGQA